MTWKTRALRGPASDAAIMRSQAGNVYGARNLLSLWPGVAGVWRQAPLLQKIAIAIAQVREAMVRHDVRDSLVAVERTGRYHHPIKNAFAKADFDTRLVHPYTTKQFRQPANADNKTAGSPGRRCVTINTVRGKGPPVAGAGRAWPERLTSPRGKPLRKAWRSLSALERLIRQRGVLL